MTNYFDKGIKLRIFTTILSVVIGFYMYSLNSSINAHQVQVNNHESVISSHTARITELDERIARFSKQFHLIQKNNEELLAYLEKYHGNDSIREDDLLKMQLLLSEHDRKLIKLLEAIKELK
jgi:septal ring factor EnvC (AmiA/AmiB activator)